MKVFIFGAGASKGSIQNPGAFGVIPLVNELFLPNFKGLRFSESNPELEIMTQDTWDECVSQVNENSSLEKWLTQRWAEIESKKQETTKFAERAFFGSVTFYLWRLFQMVSNQYNSANGYAILLRKLLSHDEEIAMISFNYDTLLDRAVQDVYRRLLVSIKDYSSARLMKPHGSINWLIPNPPGEFTIPPESQIDSAVRLRYAMSRFYNAPPRNYGDVRVYDPRHRDLNEFGSVLTAMANQPFFPVLFMPLSTKLYKTVARFGETVIEECENYLADASEIFLVGYRAQDEIIKQLFGAIHKRNQPEPRKKLHVVGVGDSDEIMESALKLSDNLEEGNTFNTGFMTFAQSYGSM